MPHTPIQVVLWDIDGTLLDFAPAERIALETCFDRFGLGPLSPERLARYSAVTGRRSNQLSHRAVYTFKTTH